MFEKELEGKLKRVFDLHKVKYDATSESQEQECLFIQVQSSKNRILDKRFVGEVTGKLNMFASLDKLPYGYFSKHISKAKIEDVAGLFFFNFEENVNTINNICERSLSFVYLFDIEYDPNLGSLTSLETVATVGNSQ